ncbi:MAG: M28 family peptidase [Acidobacteriota bacterium]
MRGAIWVGVGVLVSLFWPAPADVSSVGLAAGSSPQGAVYDIDERSHPALAAAWEAFARQDWDDPDLAGLPELRRARLITIDGPRARVWLDAGAAENLRSLGVRLRLACDRTPPPARTASVDLPPSSVPSGVLTSLAAAVSQKQMMTHLDEISRKIPTRYCYTGGMRSATRYVLQRLRQYKLDRSYYDTFNYAGYTIRNVVGVKIGTLYPDRIYIIGAHLDSISPVPNTSAPGAEDNGSGSAGVVEAARLFARLRTESTLYFVCFTGEEVGLIGSEHLAAQAAEEGWDLQGFFDMDMVGFDLPGEPDLWLEGFHANPGSVALLDLLEATARSYTDLSVYRYPKDGWGSDHEAFDEFGFPAALTIDYDWDSYSCYHKTCDVVANIVPSHLRKMVLTNVLAAAQAAGLQSSPGSIKGTVDTTGSGIGAGVKIELVGTGYQPVTTGASGTFVLRAILPGDYTLRASAPRYRTKELPVVVEEERTTKLTVRLTPAAK